MSTTEKPTEPEVAEIFAALVKELGDPFKPVPPVKPKPRTEADIHRDLAAYKARTAESITDTTTQREAS